MKRPLWISLSLVFLFICVLGGIKFFQIRKAASSAFQPPPEAVTVATAKLVSWPRVIRTNGSLSPVSGAELKAEEAGRIVKLGFESGQLVEQGQELLEIDSGVELADLQGAEALLAQSRQSLDRARLLRSKNANSATDLEKAEWGYRDAQAKVHSLNAKISRRKIIAPFKGRTGIRLVNIGDYVNPGSSIVPLHALELLYADFSVPERMLAKISVGNRVKISVDAFPAEVWEGEITAIDPVIDAQTRNFKLQALLRNTGEKLLSGMYANIEVLLSEEDKFIVIPVSSISYAPYGDSVFVIESRVNQAGSNELTVRNQIVKLGSKRGDLVTVLSGLKEGEQVVSSGVFKLRPGIAVAINQSLAPGSTDSPKPEDS